MLRHIAVFVIVGVSLLLLGIGMLIGLIVRLKMVPGTAAQYESLFTSIWFLAIGAAVKEVAGFVTFLMSWFPRLQWLHYIFLVGYILLNIAYGTLLALGYLPYYSAASLGTMALFVGVTVTVALFVRCLKGGKDRIRRWGQAVEWIVRGGLAVGTVFSVLTLIFGHGQVALVSAMGILFLLLLLVLFVWDLFRFLEQDNDDDTIHVGRKAYGFLLILFNGTFAVLGVAFTVGSLNWGNFTSIWPAVTGEKYSELDEMESDDQNESGNSDDV